MPREITLAMAWGIRAVIRVPEGQAHVLGELMLNGEPYGYPDRETCREAIEMLVRGPLPHFTGLLEPFETGREIPFRTGRGQQSRMGMGVFSLAISPSDRSDEG
jgi:hypothetical protein